MRRSLAVALCLPILAGCAAPTDEEVPAGAAQVRVHRDPSVMPLDKVLWANGTFQPTETCQTGGCIIGGFAQAGHTHDTDVAEFMQEGVAVRIRAELETPARIGNMFLRLRAPEEEVLWVDIQERREAGIDTMDALVVRVTDGIVQVRVFALNPEAGEMPYTLRIHLQAYDDAIVPGLPVLVPIEHPESVRASAVLGDLSGPFLVWDPSDRFLGIRAPNSAGEMPLAGPPGDYVLVLSGTGEAARVESLVADNATMHRIGMRTDDEFAGTLTGTGSTSWDFTLVGDDMPLAVGASVHGEAFSFVAEPRGQIEGPEGIVLTIAPEVQVTGADAATGSRAWHSRIGHPLLVPGDYTGTFSMSAGGDETVDKVWVRYNRGA